MKILIYIGVGLVILIGITMIPFLILKLGMDIILIFSISEKKAKAELEKVIKEQYDNAWVITDVRRHFNEGNMNPNMFYYQLESVDKPEIEFMFFWDAKKKVPRKTYDGQEYTLASQYQKALEAYQRKEDLKAALGPNVKIGEISYWTINLELDHEPVADEIREMTVKTATVFRPHLGDYTASMTLNFITPLEPKGIYQTPITAELNKNVYIDFRGLAKDGRVAEVREKALAQMKEKLAKKHPNYNIKPYLHYHWVNQNNIEKVYGGFEVSEPTIEGDERPATQELKGLMLCMLDLSTGKMTYCEFFPSNKDNFDAMLDSINSQIPEVYRKADNKH
ncbi:hypothetical protein LVD15_07775 [Fulvivirga maritima]|uniref:hypothetical protein n=1 Tax=Fulvivirga maritima TaxID=2904247 RepID=UPI001F1FAAAF|nr:hypothetical protein [Fulvivirga maritima]UII28316.1 hypothetical protein LVD15_07775 [Fulvivirga maritima]